MCCWVPLQEDGLQTAAAAAAATASPMKAEADAPPVSAARQAAMPLCAGVLERALRTVRANINSSFIAHWVMPPYLLAAEPCMRCCCTLARRRTSC